MTGDESIGNTSDKLLSDTHFKFYLRTFLFEESDFLLKICLPVNLTFIKSEVKKLCNVIFFLIRYQCPATFKEVLHVGKFLNSIEGDGKVSLFFFHELIFGEHDDAFYLQAM